jgi:hypothetical protein
MILLFFLVEEIMYTHEEEEAWIYAAIYFILLFCTLIGLVFIVMSFLMFYLMVVDHFGFNHLPTVSEEKL